MNYINEKLCVRIIDLIETQSENMILVKQTNCNEKIKVVHKTGENNNDKDRIQLDVIRNTKVIIENDKTNDDNNVDAETIVISDSINYHTNQNNNDNCDSDNELFLTYNNEIHRCKHDKDNNT